MQEMDIIQEMVMLKSGLRLSNSKMCFVLSVLLFLSLSQNLFAMDINQYAKERLNCDEENTKITEYSKDTYKVSCNDNIYFLYYDKDNIQHLFIYKNKLTFEELEKLKSLTIYTIQGKDIKNNKGNVYVVRMPEDEQVSYHFLASESYKLLKQGYTVNVVFATQRKDNFSLIMKMACDKKEISFDTKDEQKLREDMYLFILNMENKLWSKEESECFNNKYEQEGKELVDTLLDKTAITVGIGRIQSFGFIVYEDGRIVTGAIDGNLVANYFSTSVE